MLVKIKADLISVGGFRLHKDYWQLITVPDEPQTLRFLSDGSLLPLSGDKRVTIAARNVPEVQVDIRRVIPDQLHHIASLKSYGFSTTEFRRLNADYFTEHFRHKFSLEAVNTGKTQYHGLDLGKYLSGDSDSPRGIFLLNLSSWVPPEKQENSTSGDEAELRVMDSRFIVVTDLGILMKRSANGTRDIFIQSITSGSPVSNVKVSVIAQNGSRLFVRTTASDGHVSFPSLDAFRAEKKPVMILAEKDGDVSFLPAGNKEDRELIFSRSDTGGIYTPEDPRTLDSYLFSDRGIYRPGEKINIGLITRTADWETSVAGIPVQAEVRDPRDTVMTTMALTLDASGFNELNYTTPENASTGEWTVNIWLTGKNKQDRRLLGYTTVRVKEFEPDSQKVTLTLLPDRQLGWVKPQELKASINVQNLSGSPARGRRVASKLTMSPYYPRFKQYQEWLFYGDDHSDDNFDTQLEEQCTDEHGNADIELGLDSYNDASYQLYLISEAFDAGGGRSVTAASRVMVSPHDYLIGLRPDGSLDYISKDADRYLNLIAVNASLDKIAVSGLKVDLLEQKYHSVLAKDEYSGLYRYQSVLKELPVTSTPLAIDNQGTNFRLTTDKPGTWILLFKNSNNDVLNRIVYTVTGNANISRSLERDAELRLALNKGTYKPGENAEIAINAPYTGSGIITVEREKVYRWKWFRSDTTSSVQTIQIPEDMEGNGYINVQFIRDPGSDEIFMSPLSYNIAPFSVSREGRRARLTLDAPESVKSGEILKMKVKTDSLQRVIVYAVDEGILQAARYRQRDPLDYFFRKRALEVDSYQTLDLILPEFSKIMSLISAPGGDSSEEHARHLNPFRRKKDAPVVYWSGLTEVDGEAVFQYPVPEYFNGKIRIMALSATQDRIGHSQSYTSVRDDFVLTPGVPATVTPGDEFDVTLGIASNHPGKVPMNVTLSLPAGLEARDGLERQLQLAEKEEGLLTYRLKSKGTPGDRTLVFKVSSGDKTILRKQNLVLRPATPYRTRSVIGRMDDNELRIRDMRTMYDTFASREAMLSWSPLVLTSGLAQYLAGIQNNGSEQLISKAVSLLFRHQYQDKDRENSLERVQTQLKNIQTILLARQNNEGAIGMWRASPQVRPFITVWMVQVLLEMKQAHFPVEEALLDSANTWLKRLATSDQLVTMDELRLRAFATYLLTRQGEITTNLLADVQARLQNNYPETWNTDLSALYLSASYQLLKMDEQAKNLLQPVWHELSKAYDKAWWHRDYFDPLVQDSLRLYLIMRHFPEKADQIPPQVLENIVMRLKQNLNTTVSSAMSILALGAYSEHPGNKPDAQLNILAQTSDTQKQLVASADSTTGVAKGRFSADTSELQFSKTSGYPAWYSVTWSGYDLNVSGTVADGLEISRDYTNEKGDIISSVAQGEIIHVHLKIRANADEGVDDIAVVDLLPGGFEVVQQPQEITDTVSSGEAPLPVKEIWKPDYSDIRDDRVIIYGRASKEIQEFTYQIKAINSGIFTVPPAYAEAMYNRNIQAQTAGGTTLTVLPQPGVNRQ